MKETSSSSEVQDQMLKAQAGMLEEASTCP